MTRIEFAIEGMSCDHCTARVQQALEEAEGVQSVKVTLDPGSAVIVGDALDPEVLVAIVERAGYEARPTG